jgi:hypothetical protein
MISGELRRQADVFADLAQLKSEIGRKRSEDDPPLHAPRQKRPPREQRP